ncbi:AfsR/SARP family transcriptional regulator [Micromonospora sp. R77]|uniref:AfsR/SARP family transcriptional regulator n=1 Tax=Micromonospora sp. R77 TaxID=2925836 RepID=UPI001F61F80C|nr:AfsR/SARP family transcriptional regulator [Micromonospora sp. R77]MCI4064194.1 AfsR/SARP family transcriptional regulator [Micromonospora sp. R77]
MRFRILGAPCVENTAGVTGRRATVLVAMLAANVNKSVSVDRMVDAVWDERPPATAREQVQNCMSMLRRVLGGGADAVDISRSGRGYQLNVDPGEIDAHCFERDLRTAAEHLAAGRAESAVATYRDSLALWRGPALEGMDGVELRACAHRLDELRAAATERLIETQIELGRLDEAVADLRCQTRLHPADERYLVLLVDALLLSHRYPEALAAYRAFATGLAEDFGSRPGPAARGAERRIQKALASDTPSPASGSRRGRIDTDLSAFASMQPHVNNVVSHESELVRHLEEAMSHIRAAYSLIGTGHRSAAVERLPRPGRAA